MIQRNEQIFREFAFNFNSVVKMPRRYSRKHVMELKEQNYGLSTSTLVQIYATLALVFGIILLSLGYNKSDQCKMHSIDYSSWNNPKLDGNLIKWFKYIT